MSIFRGRKGHMAYLEGKRLLALHVGWNASTEALANSAAYDCCIRELCKVLVL